MMTDRTMDYLTSRYKAGKSNFLTSNLNKEHYLCFWSNINLYLIINLNISNIRNPFCIRNIFALQTYRKVTAIGQFLCMLQHACYSMHVTVIGIWQWTDTTVLEKYYSQYLIAKFLHWIMRINVHGNSSRSTNRRLPPKQVLSNERK